MGHTILYAERVILNEPFTLFLANDFIIQHGLGVMSDLVNRYDFQKLHLSVMKVNIADIYLNTVWL